MFFLSSVFAGLNAILIAFVLTVIVLAADLAWQARNLPQGTSWGWDPLSLAQRDPVSWTLLAFAFAAGFVRKFLVLRLKG